VGEGDQEEGRGGLSSQRGGGKAIPKGPPGKRVASASRGRRMKKVAKLAIGRRKACSARRDTLIRRGLTAAKRSGGRFSGIATKRRMGSEGLTAKSLRRGYVLFFRRGLRTVVPLESAIPLSWEKDLHPKGGKMLMVG